MRSGHVRQHLPALPRGQVEHGQNQQVDQRTAEHVADGNVVTVAYAGPKRTIEEIKRAAGERQAAFKLRYDLTKMLAQRRLLKSDTISAEAKVLTDDFAPVEALKAIEKHNRKWPSE